MNLRQWWGGRREAPPRRDAAAAWVDAVCAEPDAPQEPAGGCGWFDSSHELHAGLQVTEHLSPEQVANEVPLGWWLDWHAAAPGSAASSAPCG
jgi:hypothetical protein